MYAKLNSFSKIATVLQQAEHRQLNVSTPLMWSHAEIRLFLSGTHASSESTELHLEAGVTHTASLGLLSGSLCARILSVRAMVTQRN